MNLPTWEEYVGLALDEIISIGTGSLQVRWRLERLLEGVADQAPPERRAAVERRLTQVIASAWAALTKDSPSRSRTRARSRDSRAIFC